MNEIRDYDKEAIFIKKKFPHSDLFLILNLLKQSKTIDEVIQQIVDFDQNSNNSPNHNMPTCQDNSNKSHSLPEEPSGCQIPSSISLLHGGNQKYRNSPEIEFQPCDNHHTSQAALAPSTNNESQSDQTDFSSKLPPASNSQRKPLKYPTQLHPVLTLPKEFKDVRPNINRFGSFGGPTPSSTSNQTTHTYNYRNQHYSSSSSTSSFSLYTSPPSSYNQCLPTTISLSSEENQFESFQHILKKDVPTQLNNIEQGSNGRSEFLGFGDENNNFNGEYTFIISNNKISDQYIHNSSLPCDQYADRNVDQMSHDPKFMEPQAIMVSTYYQCSDSSYDNP